MLNCLVSVLLSLSLSFYFFAKVVLLSGFVHRAGTKYSVAVFGMFDGGQSLPLAGEEKTTLIDPPEPPPMDPPGKTLLHDNRSTCFRHTCDGISCAC